MINVLYLLIIITLGHVVFLGSMYIISRILGFRVLRVAWLSGTPIIKWNQGTIHHQIGWIVLGGYIKYNMIRFEERNFALKIILLLSGPLTILLIGLLLSDIKFANILVTIVSATLHPVDNGSIVLRKLYDHIASDVISGTGIIFVFMGFVNLLPIPITNGGQITMRLFCIPQASVLHTVFMVFGSILAIGCLLSWAVSLFLSVWG